MAYVGKQLGPYTLTKSIGSGGMADVWMAERVRMGMRQTVAIKTLSREAGRDPDNANLFLSEAKLSMLLRHSNIINVFDADDCDGECFIAMEWIDGLNLAQLTSMMWEEGESLPLHVSIYVITGVLQALDHAHNLETEAAASIVHRDVSPQNVMLSTAGEVKLMDFGVARFATEETAGIHVRGKLRYMPPEQLKGRSRDPRVDLFAVGAILHELVEGRRFRNKRKESELLVDILDGKVPRLSPGNILPQDLEQLLYGLLEAEQEDRIPSARSALQILQRWSGFKPAAFELEGYVKRYRDRDPSVQGLTGNDSVQSIHRSVGATPGSDSNPERRAVTREAEAQLALGHRAPGAPRRRNRILAPLIAGCGLALGGSSMSYAIRADQAREQPIEPSSTTSPEGDAPPLSPPPDLPDPAESPAPAPEPSTPIEPPPPSERPVPPDPAPAPPLPVPSSPTPEPPAPAPEPEPSPAKTESTPKAKQEAKKARVTVELKPGNFRWVEVKLGGRKVTLPPNGTIRPPVGKHTLRIRTDAKAPWQSIGRVELEADRGYDIVLTKPGDFRLIETR